MGSTNEPDLSEFIALSNRSKNAPCRVLGLIASFKPAERQQLIAALTYSDSCSAEYISNTAIVKWISRHGGPSLHPNALVYHRSGGCSCHDPK